MNPSPGATLAFEMRPCISIHQGCLEAAFHRWYGLPYVNRQVRTPKRSDPRMDG
jgi:hypothetical protein